MLKVLNSVSRLIPRISAQNLRNEVLSAQVITSTSGINQIASRNFVTCLTSIQPKTSLLENPQIKQIANNIISRNVIKFSMRKGKRESVKDVLLRFYRLNWGGWIRTKCGRQKKLWKKRSSRRRRLRQHILCNATQSTLLDKMAGAYWRKPKYYVDDPYEPYHTREGFLLASKKPQPFYPPEN